MADSAGADAVSEIDLNSDLGESFGNWVLGDDRAMLDLVTSANVACGFHAGDPRTILSTIGQAVHAGVAVGAQVGYRDLAGFGRRFIDMAYDDLVADVLYQISAISGLTACCGDRLRYVKPHGALYNTIVHHEQQAAAVVEAVRRFDSTLPVLGLPDSAFLAQAAKAGLRVVREAFADRAYTSAGTLLPRSEPGAVLHDPDQVAERIVGLMRSGTLTAVDGTPVPIAAESVCVHGDSPAAVAMARAVRDRLSEAGVQLRPFA